MEQLPLPRQGRRDSAWLVVVEFVIIVALFVADFRHHIFFSKVPWLFLMAWISLRWRGLGWRDVGLARPQNWQRTITIGILGGMGIELMELFVTQPLLVKQLEAAAFRSSTDMDSGGVWRRDGLSRLPDEPGSGAVSQSQTGVDDQSDRGEFCLWPRAH
jgi:hypothetical protein